MCSRSWGAATQALCFQVFRQPVCVLLRFFFDAIGRDECARHGGVAWLTSCAPVSHRPSRWLPFTEVSVTTDLLSHLDLTVASEGA